MELWLRDAAEQGTPAYRDRYDEWLEWFAEQDVEGVGFGWITLNDSGSLDPVVRIEQLTHQVELPVGGYVDKVLDAITTAHRLSDDDLLQAALTLAEGVLEERIGQPGADDPSVIRLRRTRGLRRTADVGTVEAARWPEWSTASCPPARCWAPSASSSGNPAWPRPRACAG